MRELRGAGLCGSEIRQVLRRLLAWVAAHKITAAWPSISEDRRVLMAVVDHARALETLLGGLSPRAGLEVQSACWEATRDHDALLRLRPTLTVAAAVLDRRVGALPTQSRRAAPTEPIRIIDEVAGYRLGKPTRRDGQFRRVCEAVFKLIGLASPDRAIDRYTRPRKR